MPARRSAGHSVRLKSCGYACRTTRKRFPDAGSTPAASTKFRSRTVPELPGIFCIPPPPYCQTQHPRSRPYNTAIPRAACRRIRSNAFARNSINPQTCSHEPDFAMRLNSASNIKLSRTCTGSFRCDTFLSPRDGGTGFFYLAPIRQKVWLQCRCFDEQGGYGRRP